MKISKTYYAANRDEWREWLEKHHSTETEVWLIYYKKHSGRSRVAYNDAVEEALCFGWIDSTIQRIDDDRYAQKFTPRKSDSKWSALNKRRVAKLIKERRMTDAGLAKINFSDTKDDYGRTSRVRKQLKIPQYLKQALMNSRTAWDNLHQLAPSYRRNYILWISTAKKEETRNKRLKEAITLLTQNRKLGMK
jgi:uncharacterized protein YdeI (YjbR/CyaY-like superfamily)